MSIRINEYELAWNLAALMGGVHHVSPRAFLMAQALMPFCDFTRPQIQRHLPHDPSEALG